MGDLFFVANKRRPFAHCAAPHAAGAADPLDALCARRPPNVRGAKELHERHKDEHSREGNGAAGAHALGVEPGGPSGAHTAPAFDRGAAVQTLRAKHLEIARRALGLDESAQSPLSDELRDFATALCEDGTGVQLPYVREHRVACPLFQTAYDDVDGRDDARLASERSDRFGAMLGFASADEANRELHSETIATRHGHDAVRLEALLVAQHQHEALDEAAATHQIDAAAYRPIVDEGVRHGPAGTQLTTAAGFAAVRHRLHCLTILRDDGCAAVHATHTVEELLHRCVDHEVRAQLYRVALRCAPPPQRRPGRRQGTRRCAAKSGLDDG